MFDAEFLRFLAQSGSVGVIAGLLFMFYRKDAKQFTELWREQSMTMMQIVKENTTAMAEHTEIIRSLAQRLERLDSHDREESLSRRLRQP